MIGMKEISLDSTTITRALLPNPSQEEIKGRIREKDSVTYQHWGKQVQQEPQIAPIQQPQVTPKETQPIQPTRNSSDCSTSSIVKDASVDINIDLDTYFAKSHIAIPFLELINIPSQRRKVQRILGFSKVNESPSEDAPIMFSNHGLWGIKWLTYPFLHFIKSK